MRKVSGNFKLQVILSLVVVTRHKTPYLESQRTTFIYKGEHDRYNCACIATPVSFWKFEGTKH